MRRTIVLIGVVASVGGLLGGCSGNDTPPPTRSPKSASEVAGSFPLGRYETTADVAGSRYVFVTFREGEGMEVDYPLKNGEGGSGGYYVVDGNTITISDYYCAALGFETARYTWKWDGSRLTMTPQGKDGCGARQTALAEMTQVYGSFPTGRYESTSHVAGSNYVFVTFQEGGLMSVEKPLKGGGASGSGGYYVVDATSIVISDYYCAALGFETAHYTWKWDGSRLTMTPEGKDGCVARKTALAEMTPVE